MTEEAFEKAVTKFVYSTGKRSRPFKQLTLDMAKQVLVDGRPAIEVARENGKHPPALFSALEKITNVCESSDDSLVKAELTLPGSLAEELQKFSLAYERKLDHPESQAILSRILMDLKFAVRKLQE